MSRKTKKKTKKIYPPAKPVKDFNHNGSMRKFLKLMKVNSNDLSIICKIDLEQLLTANLQNRWLEKPGKRKILNDGIKKHKKTKLGKKTQARASKNYRERKKLKSK